MAGTTKTKPDPLVIQANSFFNAGWAAGMLGMPEREFDDPDSPTRNTDIDHYREGYRMAQETQLPITELMQRMQEKGHLVLTEAQE